jgi:hypothetical protein
MSFGIIRILPFKFDKLIKPMHRCADIFLIIFIQLGKQLNPDKKAMIEASRMVRCGNWISGA